MLSLSLRVLRFLTPLYLLSHCLPLRSLCRFSHNCCNCYLYALTYFSSSFKKSYLPLLCHSEPPCSLILRSFFPIPAARQLTSAPQPHGVLTAPRMNPWQDSLCSVSSSQRIHLTHYGYFRPLCCFCRLNVAHAPFLYIKEDNVKTVFCSHLIYRQIFCYFGMHGMKNT